ncbi:hypothetical protein QF026_005029 [Streptomyces aurantiacus]|uniref:hypothetical protein n=1 Tax=Streptomyces aurantiacus TaxID=47760 RepID=UPI00278D0FFB|nr:hypothetical protein [Streptomyces aurantiacus]MDQ0776563.1 hypothetical protein [Streptomyces aurantiacus]
MSAERAEGVEGIDGVEALRPLPWPGVDGRTAYVVADPDRPGPLSRRADVVEATQLDMAAVLLGHARELAGEAGPMELRHLVVELTQALTDTLRIASGVRR